MGQPLKNEIIIFLLLPINNLGRQRKRQIKKDAKYCFIFKIYKILIFTYIKFWFYLHFSILMEKKKWFF